MNICLGLGASEPGTRIEHKWFIWEVISGNARKGTRKSGKGRRPRNGVLSSRAPLWTARTHSPAGDPRCSQTHTSASHHLTHEEAGGLPSNPHPSGIVWEGEHQPVLHGVGPAGMESCVASGLLGVD